MMTSWTSNSNHNAAQVKRTPRREPQHVAEVDFSAFYSETESERRNVSKEIIEAFKGVGFVQLINHPISEVFIEEVFAQSKDFFNLPLDSKLKLGFTTTESNRGYIAEGQSKYSFKTDRKETLEIGNEDEKEFSNMWPDEEKLPKFRSMMLKYYDALDALFLDVMRSIALGLDLPMEYFTPLCNQKHENLRLLHYPEFNRNDENQKRISPHCDLSAITLLAQDGTGGLEVKDRRTGEWIPVNPKKGAMVVNVGDMLMRWTNNVLTSTEHRVGINPDLMDEIVPERFSTAFFANANKDVTLDPIPGTFGKDNPKMYAPVNAMKFLTESLNNVVSTKEQFMDTIPRARL